MATAQTPAPSATDVPPVRCARPRVPATVLKRVEPDIPPIANQQGISGTVTVIVSLDATSRVIGTRIQSSPSAVLNAAALAAARASTYQTEVVDCRPVASEFVDVMTFGSQPQVSTMASGRPAIVVSSLATVTWPADAAYVSTMIRGPAADSAAAAEEPSAAVTALRAKLAALGIRPEDVVENGQITRLARAPVIATPGPAATPGASPVPFYSSYRSIRITVLSMRDVPAVLAAVREAPGNTGGGVQYVLRNREPAFREAVARAVRDAKARAEIAAAAAGVRLGAVQQLTVEPNDPDSGMIITSGSTYATPGDAANVPTVVVRARVTATYLIAR